MGSSVYESTDHGYISWDQGVDNGSVLLSSFLV